MGTPITTASNQPYVTVIMNDAANGTRKKYSFPEGTEFETTTHSYKLSNNGIVKTELFYEEGNPWYSKRNPETINGKTIDITLPQMVALGVFDVNKDRKIDNYDAKNIPLYMEGIPGDGFNGEGGIIADEINTRLKRSNSSFSVFDQSRCSTGANVSRDGSFYVTFVKDEKSYAEDNSKSLGIYLPEYLEKQEAQRKADQKATEELDSKYAEKHYIRHFFGITREEFEKKNRRDY